ncbi:cyclase family protein [Ruminococcus sp.]|jgi:arylformamidase|uniref:cyclase family protein n=1 Tax=Ruminococcus sp. TaxID=41978 RepID=UPI003AB3EC27
MEMQIGICGGEYEMKIYDISQEVFGCQVYPGDPTPKKRVISSMEKGDLYNLTAFSMCAHNGTHIDAPFHFIKDGKTVDSVSLDTFIGMAYVAEHNGIVSADDATEILEKAKKQNSEAAKRILIKGDAEVSAEAAKVFAESNILLLGNESQTVGPENAPMEVHLILLGAGAVLLEGIRLAEVSEGVYFLNAAPLNLSGADGSPCRAILIAAEI